MFKEAFSYWLLAVSFLKIERKGRSINLPFLCLFGEIMKNGGVK
jgi:hypothetical protein